MSNETEPPKLITSLDAISELCTKTFPVKFKLHGSECSLLVRNLTPNETELIRLQLDKSLPPVIKGKTTEEDRLDWQNPAHLERKMKIEKEVRAQAILWACPSVQEKNPDLAKRMYDPTVRQHIKEFVSGLLTDDLLELLYNAILERPERVTEIVNLSSPVNSSVTQA